MENDKHDITLLQYVEHIRERFGNQQIVKDFDALVTKVDILKTANRSAGERLEELATEVNSQNTQLANKSNEINRLKNKLKNIKKALKFTTKAI